MREAGPVGALLLGDEGEVVAVKVDWVGDGDEVAALGDAEGEACAGDQEEDPAFLGGDTVVVGQFRGDGVL